MDECQTTRVELAQHMKEHYERISKEVCDWCSGIPKAIDAWEREPELKAEIERLQARARELESELAANAKVLAQQCDLAREAEIKQMAAEKWTKKLEVVVKALLECEEERGRKCVEGISFAPDIWLYLKAVELAREAMGGDEQNV